jgi:uncharacterized membrane protein
MGKELIIAGYSSQHAALLARTALSRQQNELSISTKDIAVVTRANNGQVTILESVTLGEETQIIDSFWTTLAELLFSGADAGTAQSADRNQLESIGINPLMAKRISDILQKGSTAVFLITDAAFEPQASAMLSASQGNVLRIRLEADYFNKVCRVFKSSS